MGTETLLKQVGTDRPVVNQPPAPPKKDPLEEAALQMIMLGLKTLSQRVIVALSDLFTLLTCVSAFVLWQDVLPNPNSFQLVGLGLYGMFLLLLHLVRKRN